MKDDEVRTRGSETDEQCVARVTRSIRIGKGRKDVGISGDRSADVGQTAKKVEGKVIEENKRRKSRRERESCRQTRRRKGKKEKEKEKKERGKWKLRWESSVRAKIKHARRKSTEKSSRLKGV
jgi:hypothetical protein